MICVNKKCKAELLNLAYFCHVCGKKQSAESKKRSKRLHGDGTFTVRGDKVRYQVKDDDTGERLSFTGDNHKDCIRQHKAYLANKNEEAVIKTSTIKDWSKKWLESYKKNKVVYGTYRNYEMYVDNHIIPDLGNRWLHETLPIHIEAFFSDPKRTKLSASAKKHIRIALKGIFETAIENKLCKENPVTTKKRTPTKKETSEKTTIKYFKKEEVNKIIKDAKTHVYGVYVLFLLYTGLRISEVISIKWSDIDLKNNIIYVTSASTRVEKGREDLEPKGGRARAIGIKRNFKIILNKMQKDSVFVFGINKTKHMSPSTYARRYRAFFDDTGNDYLPPHSCRHTFGTFLLRGGADLRSVQEALGHSSVAVTEMYTHTDADNIKSSAAKLGY